MTGLTLLRQAYGLLDDDKRAAEAESDEQGLIAVNQIYSELWSREHRTAFVPLSSLRQSMQLSFRCLPALTYGVAMLLCLNDEDKEPYSRYQALYQRAASHTGGVPDMRQDRLFRGCAD